MKKIIIFCFVILGSTTTSCSESEFNKNLEKYGSELNYEKYSSRLSEEYKKYCQKFNLPISSDSQKKDEDKQKIIRKTSFLKALMKNNLHIHKNEIIIIPHYSSPEKALEIRLTFIDLKNLIAELIEQKKNFKQADQSLIDEQLKETDDNEQVPSSPISSSAYEQPPSYFKEFYATLNSFEKFENAEDLDADLEQDKKSLIELKRNRKILLDILQNGTFEDMKNAIKQSNTQKIKKNKKDKRCHIQ